MSKCIGSDVISGLKLSSTYGSLPEDGVCEGDEYPVTLVDELGSVAFDQLNDSFGDFHKAVEGAVGRPDSLLIGSSSERDRLTFGGQMIAMPEGCKRAGNEGAPSYSCPREDGLTEGYEFAGAGGRMKMDQAVRVPDGRVVRRRVFELSGDGQSGGRPRVDRREGSMPHWYAGGSAVFFANLSPLRRADDKEVCFVGTSPYMHEGEGDFVVMDPDGKEIKVSVIDVGAEFGFGGKWVRDDPAANCIADGFDPIQRRAAYELMDRFIARHDTAIDFEDRLLRVGKQQIGLVTDDSAEVSRHEAARNLIGALAMAQYLPLVPSKSLQLFYGKPDELYRLAEKNGAAPTCLDAVKWSFAEAGDESIFVLGLSCFDSGMTFIASDKVHSRNRFVAHEIGHWMKIALLGARRLHGGALLRGLFSSSDFRDLFLDYVHTSLIKAGVEDADRDLVMFIAAHPHVTVFTIRDEYQKRLNRMWVEHRLERYFPNRDSLSDEDEFFARLIEYYFPTYEFGQPRVYNGFYRALDKYVADRSIPLEKRMRDEYPGLMSVGDTYRRRFAATATIPALAGTSFFALLYNVFRRGKWASFGVGAAVAGSLIHVISRYFFFPSGYATVGDAIRGGRRKGKDDSKGEGTFLGIAEDAVADVIVGGVEAIFGSGEAG